MKNMYISKDRKRARVLDALIDYLSQLNPDRGGCR